MKMAKHIIIDIETLGRRNDAAITQIGIEKQLEFKDGDIVVYGKSVAI